MLHCVLEDVLEIISSHMTWLAMILYDAW